MLNITNRLASGRPFSSRYNTESDFRIPSRLFGPHFGILMASAEFTRFHDLALSTAKVMPYIRCMSRLPTLSTDLPAQLKSIKNGSSAEDQKIFLICVNIMDKMKSKGMRTEILLP
jgi:hypothetical protein